MHPSLSPEGAARPVQGDRCLELVAMSNNKMNKLNSDNGGAKKVGEGERRDSVEPKKRSRRSGAGVVSGVVAPPSVEVGDVGVVGAVSRASGSHRVI